MAHQDDLTGLLDRAQIYDRINNAILDAKKKDKALAVLFLDLDGFSKINKAIGRAEADFVLVEVGKRLVYALGKKTAVARTGGDEFLILINNLQTEKTIRDASDRIVDAFKQPFRINKSDFYLSVGIGCALYPYDGEDLETLIIDADTAMYKAKENGKNQIVFFSDTTKLNRTQVLKQYNDLLGALEREELELVYQLQLNAGSGKLIGLEASVGWYHPKIGMIDQHELMTIAEKTGLIAPIELWAIWSACKQNKAWLDAGYQISPITVKLSSYQFEDASLVSSIKDVLQGTGLSPEYLVISISESMLMRESIQAADTLKQLERLGVRNVIDSMGITGSTLTYLKRLSVDEIRTDMRSIGGIPKDKQSGKTVIALKKNIRQGKFAEDSESKVQVDFSEDGDCYTIQEYYFRPITANDIEKLYGMPDDDFAASNISGKD